MFLKRFNGADESYVVYFLVNKKVLKFKEILETRLGVKFEQDLFSSKLKNVSSENICINLSVLALDVNGAASQAYETFSLFMRYYKFLGNRDQKWYEDKCLVKDSSDNISFPHMGPERYFYSQDYDDRTLGRNSERIITKLLENTGRDDFFKIDKIALELGIDVNSYQRIGAGIRYGLIVSSYNGNTCVEKEKLYEFVRKKLNVEDKYIDEVMINLKAVNKVIEEEIEGKSWIFLDEFYRLEKNIATRLYMMMRSKNVKYIKTFDLELEKVESQLAINLSDKQKEALKEVNNSNVTIITGGPGTRKNYNN